jgi:CheY-like chemotaxis protein
MLISDIRIPDIDGPALFDILKRQHPELIGRIAFMTGDTLSAHVKTFLDHAGRPFIEKPVTPNELRELVRSMSTPAQ